MYVGVSINHQTLNKQAASQQLLVVLASSTSIEHIPHPTEIPLKPQLQLGNWFASTIKLKPESSFTHHGDITTASIEPDHLMW